jgi:hypothetical protein
MNFHLLYPSTARCVEPLHTSFDHFIGGFRCVAAAPSNASALASASTVDVTVDAQAVVTTAASAASADDSDAAALLSRAMNSLVQPVMEPADICGGLLNTWAGASAQVVCTKCGQVLPLFSFIQQISHSQLCVHVLSNSHHEQQESTTSLQIAETTGATILNGGISFFYVIIRSSRNKKQLLE